ncbi:hypothetical protein ACP70R_017824 [Stipagrostis hirtigluma subsp. patula]
MYADRSSGRKRSVMDRLGSGGGGGSRSRSDDAKSEDKNPVVYIINFAILTGIDGLMGLGDVSFTRTLWELKVPGPASSSRNLKADQKSHLQQSNEVVKKSPLTDLREKLSGVQRPQLNSTVQIIKPVQETVKIEKPVPKRDTPPTAAPPLLVTKKVSAPAPSAPKKSEEKADLSLECLLKSLDLEKYLINFQAEEVDMKALVYMNEEDMKSLGIPMGPRKKILSALARRKRKSSKSLPTS